MSKTIIICTEFMVDDEMDINPHDLAALMNGACDNIPMEEIPDGVFVGMSYVC
jgi:hypothetical protein